MVGSLIVSRNTDDYIYSYSGLSTVLTGSFSSPDSAPYAIAINPNTNNLHLAGATDDLIYEFKGITPTVIGSLDSPNTSTPEGLTFLGLNMYSSFNGTIYRHSGISTTILSSGNVTNTDSLMVSGETLYHLDRLNDALAFVYTHVGSSLTNIAGSFQLQQNTDGFNSNATFDGEGNIICLSDIDTSNTEDYWLYQYDGVSIGLLGSTQYGLDNKAIGGLSFFDGAGPLNFTESFSDTVNFTDPLDSIVTYTKNLVNTLNNSEVLSQQIVNKLTDNIVLEEAFAKSVGYNNLVSEELILTDKIIKEIIVQLQLSDTQSFGELIDLTTPSVIVASTILSKLFTLRIRKNDFILKEPRIIKLNKEEPK